MIEHGRGPGQAELDAETPLTVHQIMTSAIGALNEGDAWERDRKALEKQGAVIDHPKAPQFYSYAAAMIDHAVRASFSPVVGVYPLDADERQRIHTEFIRLNKVDAGMATRVRDLAFGIGVGEVTARGRASRVKNLFGISVPKDMVKAAVQQESEILQGVLYEKPRRRPRLQLGFGRA